MTPISKNTPEGVHLQTLNLNHIYPVIIWYSKIICIVDTVFLKIERISYKKQNFIGMLYDHETTKCIDTVQN